MQRDPRAFLWDVQQAAGAITEFTAGLDAAGYRASPLIRSAVERQFEIIGEALNQLSKVSPDLARQAVRFQQAAEPRDVRLERHRGARRRRTVPQLVGQPVSGPRP